MIKGLLVFYIDIGTMPPYKAEAYIDRWKDGFRASEKLKEQGYEILWVPVRANSLTKIEMIPFAEGCMPVMNRYYSCSEDGELEVDGEEQ